MEKKRLYIILGAFGFLFIVAIIILVLIFREKPSEIVTTSTTQQSGAGGIAVWLKNLIPQNLTIAAAA